MKRRTTLGSVAVAAALTVAAALPATGAVSRSSAPALQPARPAAKDPRATAAVAADRLVSAAPARFRRSAKDGIVRKAVYSGAGGLQHVAYERTYAGLPVHGGDFVVATTAGGSVLSTMVNQKQALSVSTTPKVSAKAAAATSRARLSKITTASAPRLTVMAQGAGRLAYETVVEGFKGSRPSKLHVFVDARTGKVAETWDEVVDADDQAFFNGGSSNPVEIPTTASGSSFLMRDRSRSGMECANQSGTVYSKTTDAWGNAGGTSLETACVDVMYAAAQQSDMLKNWLDRNGQNGTGGSWPMRVGLNDVNAYWNGSFTNFGHNQANNKQVTEADVVAHELGHGIFQNTPGGSSGSNEKGGLNESVGDIFGALTEWYMNQPRVAEQLSGSTAVVNFDPPDFLVGEEADLVGSGEIRNMFDPAAEGDPACYSSSVPGTEVHAAAGVQNHWFVLLAIGSNANDPANGKPNSSTCNGSTVTGVGVQKAGRIFMEMLNLKTSTWTHSLARKASLVGVNNLVAAGKATCADFDATKAAWNAVSVPANSTEPAACAGSAQDFSVSLSPASGTVLTPPGSLTSEVGTQTTAGATQSVTLSATGSPAGPTATFSPATVTSGQSSTMTIDVPAGTANGTYTISVLADGTAADHTATYTVTVGTGPTTVFSDDFESVSGWSVNPSGADTASTGVFERGAAQATSSSGVATQLVAAGGSYDLVTGASAGASAGANDVDGGVTSVQSPAIVLPSGGSLTLSLQWYLAHLSNASSADYVRVRVVGTSTVTVVNQAGAASNRAAAWQSASVDVSSLAGQTVRIVVDAADAGSASLVEAAIDNVKIIAS